MKKIIIIIIIFFLLITFTLLTKKEKNIEYDKICNYTYETEIDGESYKTNSTAYLNLNGNRVQYLKIVNKIDVNDYSYSVSIANDYVNIFKDINGINFNLTIDNDYYIEEIEYDFKNIDLLNIKDLLGYLYDEESFLSQKYFSDDYDKVKDFLLNEYSCK